MSGVHVIVYLICFCFCPGNAIAILYERCVNARTRSLIHTDLDAASMCDALKITRLNIGCVGQQPANVETAAYPQ